MEMAPDRLQTHPFKNLREAIRSPLTIRGRAGGAGRGHRRGDAWRTQQPL